MKVKFYSVSDFNNTLDRQIGQGTEVEIKIKSKNFNLLKPTFLFSATLNNLFAYNYIYIPNFRRYYFIDDIEIIANELYKISCRVDVLKTYADLIKNSSVLVTKSTDFNKFVNTGYEITVKKEITVIPINIELNKAGTNILLANKGGTK